MRLHYDIPKMWDVVAKIRSEVTDLLARHPAEVREAVVMAASELAENAIKYGMAVSDAPFATLDVRVSDRGVEVETRNGVPSPDSAEAVMERVKRISEIGNTEDLYVGRLMELAAGTGQGKSQFGLYRIACEGHLKLSCSFDGRVLTVGAMREF